MKFTGKPLYFLASVAVACSLLIVLIAVLNSGKTQEDNVAEDRFSTVAASVAEPRRDGGRNASAQRTIVMDPADYISRIEHLRVEFVQSKEEGWMVQLSVGRYPVNPVIRTRKFLASNLPKVFQKSFCESSHAFAPSESLIEFTTNAQLPWKYMQDSIESALDAGVGSLLIAEQMWVRCPNPFSTEELWSATGSGDGGIGAVDYARLDIFSQPEGGSPYYRALFFDFPWRESPIYVAESKDNLLAFLQKFPELARSITWELHVDETVETCVVTAFLADYIRKAVLGRQFIVRTDNPYTYRERHDEVHFEVLDEDFTDIEWERLEVSYWVRLVPEWMTKRTFVIEDRRQLEDLREKLSIEYIEGVTVVDGILGCSGQMVLQAGGKTWLFDVRSEDSLAFCLGPGRYYYCATTDEFYLALRSACVENEQKHNPSVTDEHIELRETTDILYPKVRR
jgi:hypothetical protein